MKPSTFKLTPQLEELLDRLAYERKLSRSAVVREALQVYAAQPLRSATAAAGELVGSLSGPWDLSSSPKHLAGFGE